MFTSKRSSRFVIVTILMLAVLAGAAYGASQLDSAVDTITLSTTAEYTDVVWGQKAQDDQFILTPDSCFFYPRGAKLIGRAASSIPGANLNDGYTYTAIDNITKLGQLIQWPLMPANTGQVSIDFYINTTNTTNPGAELIVRFGDLEQNVTVVSSDGSGAQPWNLTANITQAGVSQAAIQFLEIELVDLHGASKAGKVEQVVMSGSALADAYLLRARYRPRAAHGAFKSSSFEATGLDCNAWVMEMRPDFTGTMPQYFYGPMTTDFGYFGVTFHPVESTLENDFEITDEANFSMWSYSAGQDPPPLLEQSHLLSVGNGDQFFDGYGHEGSGVKPEKGNPFDGEIMDTLILAMRMEQAVVGDVYQYKTYTGYYWDRSTEEWKLYCVGRDYLDESEQQSEGVDLRQPTAFVEVAKGEANVERTGQIPRTEDFRGWVRDENGTWHALDTLAATSSPSDVWSRDWTTSPDGWGRIIAGGVIQRDWNSKVTRSMTPGVELPNFMDTNKLTALDSEPVTATIEHVVGGADGELDVTFTLEGLDSAAEVKLYYGGEDGLTLIYEEDNKPEGWDAPISLGSFGNGEHTVSVSPGDLTSEGYCRILVEAGDQGRYWSKRSAHWIAPYAFTVASDAAAGTKIGAVAMTNPSAGAVTYSIVSGNDEGYFAIGRLSGKITLAEALPLCSANTYKLAVQGEFAGYSVWVNALEVIIDKTNLGRDSDGDGIIDVCDRCPNIPNPDQLDSDGPDPALSPVAAWNFDEGAGTTATDVVAGHVGTFNSVGFSDAGVRGSALDFPTGGSSVSVPASSDFDITEHLTIALWVKPSAFPATYHRFLSRANYNFRLIGQKPHFYVKQGGVFKFARSNVSINANEWTHLAAVWDGTGMGDDELLHIYVNGIEVADYQTQHEVSGSLDSFSTGINLGNMGTERYEGLMDELGIFDRAFSESEILTLIANGFGDGTGDACDYCPNRWNPDGFQDFSGGGTAYTLNSNENANPVVESGSLRLTEAQESEMASIVFEPLSSDPISSFEVSFDFRIGGGSGADGISFALMDADIHDSSTLFGENGPGAGSITVSLDTYRGAFHWVILIIDGVEVALDPLTITLDDNQWHHADISFDGSELTLVLTPFGGPAVTPLDARPVAGFTPFVARYGFGARTGGLTNEHRVDNIRFVNTSDTDGDGVGDGCDVLEGCNDMANLYLDSIINLYDFALLAKDWLCTSDCSGDIDGDDDTDMEDLAIIAANWLCGTGP